MKKMGGEVKTKLIYERGWIKILTFQRYTPSPFTRLSSSMAPRNWATSEQLHFLRGYIPIFVEYTAKENQSKFWPRLNEAWFSRWPELDVLVKENKLPPQASTSDPDAPDSPDRETPRYQLTIEERELYGMAIQTRKQVSVHLLNGDIVH